MQLSLAAWCVSVRSAVSAFSLYATIAGLCGSVPVSCFQHSHMAQAFTETPLSVAIIIVKSIQFGMASLQLFSLLLTALFVKLFSFQCKD